MIRISDIMEKEVINVKNGKRLGFIQDIEIDAGEGKSEGKIVSFTIVGDGGRGFFSRQENQTIFWSDILKIGCDTIIVNIGSDFDIDEIEAKYYNKE